MKSLVALAYVNSRKWPGVTTIAEAEADLDAGLRRRRGFSGWKAGRLEQPRWYNLLLDAWEAAATGDEPYMASYLEEFADLIA